MKKILAVFLIIFLISCIKNPGKNFHEITINNGDKLITIHADFADDNEKQIRGLMFRERLDENAGMLFIFDKEEKQIFWMKNTLIPLDIIFVDKSFRIVNIEHAVPCKQEPCTLYESAAPSEYVLEVNYNFTAKNGIKAGNEMTI